MKETYLELMEYIDKIYGLYRCTYKGCNNIKRIKKYSIKYGEIRSCGCLRKEIAYNKHYKHGMRYTPEYHSWQNMKDRCYNINNEFYKDYGDRGIVVCDRWLKSFENFYEDMGKMPSKKYTLERKDNNGNYEQSNCKWATYKDKTQNLGQWSKDLNINYTTLRSRLNESGYSIEKAFTASVNKRRDRKNV